jgi:hypothetical protein
MFAKNHGFVNDEEGEDYKEIESDYEVLSGFVDYLLLQVLATITHGIFSSTSGDLQRQRIFKADEGVRAGCGE